MKLVIEYSSEAQAAYIRIGSPRPRARTLVETGRDDSVLVDLDENGLVTGIELLGVSYPVIELLEDVQAKRYRDIETVTPLRGEL